MCLFCICVFFASVSVLHLCIFGICVGFTILQFLRLWTFNVFKFIYLCLFPEQKNIIIFPKRSNFASCDFYKIVCFKNFMKHICFWRFYQHQLSHSMQMDCSAFDLWSLVQHLLALRSYHITECKSLIGDSRDFHLLLPYETEL